MISWLCLMLVTTTSPAAAGPGDLDQSFGGNGKVTTGFGPGRVAAAYAVAVQRDGKIVAAGTVSTDASSAFAVVRYRTDGSLDPTFGGDGKVLVPLGGAAYAVAIQGDGKLVVAGGAGSRFGVVRLNADGSLDPTFGENGEVTTDVTTPGDPGSRGGGAAAVALQSDGKIVVAGTRGDEDEAESDTDAVLVRYKVDGSLDTTFGTNGITIANPGGVRTEGHAVVVKPTGKILVAGVADLQFMLARFNSDGTDDRSFGRSGAVVTTFGTDHSDEGFDLTLLDHGKIVLAGEDCPPGHACVNHSRFALARYTRDGTLDPSFSGDGKRITRFGPGRGAAAYAVAVQRDGKIVAAGRQGWGCSPSGCPTNSRFALAQYNADGSLDTSFGEQGKLTVRFGRPSFAWAADVVIQDDGKIVAAGLARKSGIRFALARCRD
jgi:uncharacterized delta-60 repeat protein